MNEYINIVVVVRRHPSLSVVACGRPKMGTNRSASAANPSVLFPELLFGGLKCGLNYSL